MIYFNLSNLINFLLNGDSGDIFIGDFLFRICE